MTFTIKHRVLPGAPMIAEYLCPDHGRFEATVSRDEKGDPPVTQVCGELMDCGPRIAGLYGEVRCDQQGEHVISAPKPRILSVVPTALIRGGDTERRPGMLDTRPLADGMPMREWKKLQAKHTEERRHHQLVAKGLKSPRIQSSGGGSAK